MEAPLRFVFEQHISVFSLSPPFGPTSGNTLVNVSGQFTPASTYVCRFGFAEVAGVFVTPNQLACLTPGAHEGSSKVEVSSNGVDWTGGQNPS